MSSNKHKAAYTEYNEGKVKHFSNTKNGKPTLGSNPKTVFNPDIHIMIKNPNGSGYIQKLKTEILRKLE